MNKKDVEILQNLIKTGKCHEDCFGAEFSCPIFFECIFKSKDGKVEIAKKELLKHKIKLL